MISAKGLDVISGCIVVSHCPAQKISLALLGYTHFIKNVFFGQYVLRKTQKNINQTE